MASDNPSDQADDAPSEFADLPHRQTRVRVECGGLTHRGKVRTNNEDQFLIAKLAKSMRVCQTSLPGGTPTHFSDEEGYLLVVADGMGGAAAGEQASQVAVETVEAFVLNVVKWFLHLGGQDEQALLSELRLAFERADRMVVERAENDRSLAGMGTTLTMAYSVATDLFVVHAGDSRAYLYRDGQLEQLTSDHTFVQFLVDSGTLSPEAARHHHRRHVITNYIGGPRKGVHTQVHKLELLDGDVLLLCTDGLSEPVAEAQLAQVLAQCLDPDEACRQLVGLALQGGGPDNVTVVVARYQVT